MAKTTELFPLSAQSLVVHAYCRYNSHFRYQDPETTNKFYQAWNPPPIPQKNTDVTFIIPANMAFRPDLISYNFYDTPLLGWVIPYVNNIMNPLDHTEGLYAGRAIRVPDISTIISVLTF
jgi:hypothetical protein